MCLLVEAVRGGVRYIWIEPLSPGGIGLVASQAGGIAQSQKIRHNSEAPTEVGDSAPVSPFGLRRRCMRAAAYRQFMAGGRTGAMPAWQLSQALQEWTSPLSFGGAASLVAMARTITARVGSSFSRPTAVLPLCRAGCMAKSHSHSLPVVDSETRL